MELGNYLDILRRRWWLVVLAPLIALVVAYAVTEQITPTYSARSEVLVLNKPANDPVTELNQILTNDGLSATYVRLIDRRPVYERAAARLGGRWTPEELADKVSVAAVTDTQIIGVTATDHNSAEAARISNAVVDSFIALIGTELGEAGSVIVSETADAPAEPVSPKLKLNLLLAGTLGLVLAAAAVLAVEQLDDAVRSTDEIEAMGLTTIGAISRFPRRRARDAWRGWTPLIQEDFRELRTNIHFLKDARHPKTIVVTSQRRGEGKSSVACRLARVLAQADHDVILVDANLRRPSRHEFSIDPRLPGLTDLIIRDDHDLDDVLSSTSVPNLAFLSPGAPEADAAEMLSSRRMTALIDAMRSRADYVIIDTPPLGSVTDGTILAGTSDATILVVEAGRTRLRDVNQMLKTLGAVRANVIGVVMNKHQRADRNMDKPLRVAEVPVVRKAEKSVLWRRRMRPRSKQAAAPSSNALA